MNNATKDLEAGDAVAERDHAGHGSLNGTRHINGYENGSNAGGAPLQRVNTAGTTYLPAFGGEFQPGLYKPSFRKFGNPAPLGLCAFALTTFVLSLVNAGTRGVSQPNIVVGLAYAYGGLVQLLAGMWEMAVGNTFGATALSSYGGFWISYAIIETGGFGIASAYETSAAHTNDLNNALGFYLIGWFIFTFLMFMCTLKSTVAFSSLFFFLDITFLLLAIAHFQAHPDGTALTGTNTAAGVFGLITAFIAWWNAMAGLLETSNSFFQIPVAHFPWSETVKAQRTASMEKAD